MMSEEVKDASAQDTKPKAAKAKVANEPTPEAKQAAAGAVEEQFKELGAKSAENRSKGGDDVKISLTDKIVGRMTKDFGFLKKGHVQEFSQQAFDLYNGKGVIEKV